jgi:hypothetical protein
MRPAPRLLLGAVATVLAATAVVPPAAQAAAGKPPTTESVLRGYAVDTWRSMAAMADSRTGLVSDNVGGSLDSRDRAAYTSPTNIGAYMWSAIAARDIGIITPTEARDRIATTVRTLSTLEKHEPSGMFYNWYSPKTGAKLTKWPVNGDVVHPFLSSVDNGWLATALQMVAKEVPDLAPQATAIVSRMDFGYYYDPAENQIRGGFWVEDPNPNNPVEVKGNYRDPSGNNDVWYTGHHYGAFNTEPRMASYLGIAAGQIPQKHYFGTFRTFQNVNCDYSWTEQRAVGHYATYLGQQVFEGAYQYRGMKLVPTWGGSMFEALMVPLFVPEEKWGTTSWALTHPTYVQAQIEHGMTEARYGYWGFSPSNDPAGGYREYGVDQIGMNGDGYTSDEQRTTVDEGYGDCRPAQPLPTSYGEGVVTPHASFLALRFAKGAALKNLAGLRASFDAYGPGGFYDSVNVTTGQVSKRYLSLDQGMVMAALGNALAGDDMRDAFSTGSMEQRVAPLMRMEEFTGITEAGQ